MTSIVTKFKSLAIGVMVLSLVMGMTLSSCTTDKKSQNTENVEAASESEEHPTDSKATESESEEHPSDTTKTEHPNN